jgi:ATP-dependent protease HslVU (ClpYQ) peptidase subunit
LTVVAALADGQRVVMAADTASNYAGTQIQGARKIRRVEFPTGGGGMLVAGSGSGAIFAVLAGLDVEAMPPTGDSAAVWDAWAERVASTFTNRLTTMTPPLLRSTEGGGQQIDGAFLLGAGGRLWYLFTHQAVPVPDGIAALGSGGDLALGVLNSTDLRAVPLQVPVVRAVEVACKYDPYCAVTADGPVVETLG